MKPRFWKSDWFAGLLTTIVIVFFSGSVHFQNLERLFYDWALDNKPSSLRYDCCHRR